MGQHADRTRDRDALAAKVARLREQLGAYETALAEADQLLAGTPEDAPEPDQGWLTAAGVGAAHNPTVMVRDNVDGA